MEAWYGDGLPQEDEPVRRVETRWSTLLSPPSHGDRKEELLASFYEAVRGTVPAYDVNSLRVLAVVPARTGRRAFLVESELSVLDRIAGECDEPPAFDRRGVHVVNRDEDRIARDSSRRLIPPIPPIRFRGPAKAPHLGIEIAVPTGRRMPGVEPDSPSHKDLDACADVLAGIYRAAGQNAIDLIRVTGWRLLNGSLHLELHGERGAMLAAESEIRRHMPAQRAEWLREFDWRASDWQRLVRLRTTRRLAPPPEGERPAAAKKPTVPVKAVPPSTIPDGAIAVGPANRNPAFVATVTAISVLILASFVRHAVAPVLLALTAFVFLPQVRRQLLGYRWPAISPSAAKTGPGPSPTTSPSPGGDGLHDRVRALLSASDVPLVDAAWAAHARLADLAGGSSASIDAIQAMRLLDADMPDLVASYEAAARHASKETAEQMRVDLRRALEDVRGSCDRAAQPLQRSLETDFAVHRAQIGRYANDFETE